MYWRAWELAWLHLRPPKPESGFIANYVESPHDDHLFMWDSAFSAQFGAYGRLAGNFIGALDNLYAKQMNDGFICRKINATTGHNLYDPFNPNSTGPNILAWAEWRYYRHTGNENRLRDVFWPLTAYHRWCRAHRTWPNKLYWATGISSGMNNQPRIPDNLHYHQHWTWLDASLQAILSCRVLIQMATILSEEDLLDELNYERTYLLRRVNDQLWNESTNFYHDRDPAGKFSPVKSISAYWALLDKAIVPTDRMGSFIRHLREPTEFKRPHPVPSISADSPGYDGNTGNHWSGGVWSPTNYMLLKGLRNVGQDALAHEIAINHVANIFEVFQRTDTFWSYYAPESAVAGARTHADFVGWTGLSAISILLEDVIGLSVDWPLHKVVWDRRLNVPGRYGVRNYPLGEQGTLDIVGDQDSIEIITDTPFYLTVIDPEGSLQSAIRAGTVEIKL